MAADAPRRLVLLGAGHAHIEVLRRFACRPMPGLRLTLITPSPTLLYSGAVPGVIAGLLESGDASIDVAALAARAGAALILDEAAGIEGPPCTVICRGGARIGYDLLSLDIGASARKGVPGADAQAVAIKPFETFLRAFATMREDIATGRCKTIVIIGGGAGGVEIAFAMAAHFARIPGAHAVSLTVLTATPDILPGFPQAFRHAARAELARRGITLCTQADVVAVAADSVTRADGETVACDRVIRATGAHAPAWLRDTPLALSDDGFVQIDATLRTGDPRIFAVGDVAAFAPQALPKAGVHAVRQGPVLAHNLRAALTGQPLQPYRPQRDTLTLLSLGDGRALGTRNGLTMTGRWVWWWKRWIDRRFVARYRGR